MVQKSLIPVEKVVDHLQRYGLQTKPFVKLENARVLGLQVRKNGDGQLVWQRGNDLPVIGERISRRELFSICGRLVGHYPVAGWLRLACSFIKRCCEGSKWDDDVGETARKMLEDMMSRVAKNDPVGGVWCVGDDKSSVAAGTVWCDASSIAIGCSLEMDNEVVEDAAWLRKKHDGTHINLAELDSVVRGVNLAIKWHLKEVKIKTDSATVHSWLKSVIFESHTASRRMVWQKCLFADVCLVRRIWHWNVG